MSSQKIKFEDKEVDKKEFYSSKQAILLDSVDLSKTVVSNRWKICDTKYKYFCGYLNNDVIQPLCFILPQMSGYIKYFDDGGKNMSFVISPIRDDKYIITELKIFENINLTTFTDNVVPIEKNRYICIPAIDIDSVLKIDKEVFPQAYLEQRKYN